MTGTSFLTMVIGASMRRGYDSLSVVWMRVRTISTRRFFARPSAVELVSIGSWLA